jgi:hypothetical protein
MVSTVFLLKTACHASLSLRKIKRLAGESSLIVMCKPYNFTQKTKKLRGEKLVMYVYT